MILRSMCFKFNLIKGELEADGLMGEGYLVIGAGKGYTKGDLLDIFYRLVGYAGISNVNFMIDYRNSYIIYDYFVYSDYQKRYLSFEDLEKYW